MITKQQIEGLIEDKLVEQNCFVVGLSIKEGNKINLEIDSFEGITIKDCVDFSRAIEHNLDREEEDFEIDVSSPGLDKPFRVKQQYQKNIGKNIKTVLADGKTVEGRLEEVNEETIVVEHTYKEKIEGKKKKQTIVEQKKINFNNIKDTTIVISFK